MALIRFVIICIVFFISPSAAQLGTLPYSGAAVGPIDTTIYPLYIGGGGFSTGLAMAPDGTMATRVDIFGAYAASTTVGTVWSQLATQSSMPTVYTSIPTPYLYGGALEIAIDPSTSNNFWMLYSPNGGNNLTTLLKSTNKGTTWVTTGFPLFTGTTNGTSSTRITAAQRIVVDPNNPLVIWASTNTHLYESHDGGNNFNQVDGGSSGLPAATGGVVGFVAMQFDPTSTVTGGKTTRLIVGDNGNGVYISTNAHLGTSATFTLVSTSSTTPGHGKMASDGNYYFNTQAPGTSIFRIDTSGTLTSTTPSANAIATLAVDPNNPARAVTTRFGQIVFGGPVNGTVAWSSPNGNFTTVGGDAGWQVFGQGPKTEGEIFFDPFVTTSSTSITIGTGSRGPFTVSAGLNIANGDLLRITNTGTPTNYMLGTATYIGTSLTITVLASDPGGYLGIKIGGAGTFAAWTITKERLWLAAGFGMYWTDGLFATAAFTWNSMNVGIDDMVARQVIWPTSNVPVLVMADIPIWQVPSNPVGATTGLADFGSSHTCPLCEGVAIDWTSATPTTLVTVGGSSNVFNGKNTVSGAAASWAAFAANPTGGAGTFVAATDANNIVSVNSTSISFTTNGGTSWSAVTGASIPSTGWSISGGANPNYQPICADRGGTAATFYAYNYAAGKMFKIVSGVATLQATVALDPSASNFAYQLKCIPGNSGHLTFTGGTASDAAGLYNSLATVLAFTPLQATYPLQFSSDGGVTWTKLANVANPLAVGFGAAKPGNTYPSIYFPGWKSGSYGIWRSDDFNPASLGSETWSNVGTFARGAIDLPTAIEGDPNQWGQFIICHNGTSCSVGRLNGTNVWP